MKFKYLSLCLCLSLFACSDDENILPEEKPAVPQGEPMEDTPIVQKDYGNYIQSYSLKPLKSYKFSN